MDRGLAWVGRVEHLERKRVGSRVIAADGDELGDAASTAFPRNMRHQVNREADCLARAGMGTRHAKIRREKLSITACR